MRLALEIVLAITVVIMGGYIVLFSKFDSQPVHLHHTDNPALFFTQSLVATPDLSQPLCDLKPVPQDQQHVLLNNGKTSRIYRVGDSLSNVSVIADITSEGIILRYHPFEHFISYSKPSASDNDEAEPSQNTAFPFPGPVTYFNNTRIPNRLLPYIQVVSENKIAVKRGFINKFLASRDELQNIRFATSSKGGFQATSISDNSSFSALGFETGDIIKAVNSTELNSVSDIMALYGNIEGIQTLQVRLERQGQERYFFYQLVD